MFVCFVQLLQSIMKTLTERERGKIEANKKFLPHVTMSVLETSGRTAGAGELNVIVFIFHN
jgi:hypothetical protein